MAVVTPLNYTIFDGDDSYTVNLPAAYIKATVRLCTPSSTVVELNVWASVEARNANAPSLRYDSSLRKFPTALDLQAANPVDYAYQLLEASGEFPDATWGV